MLLAVVLPQLKCITQTFYYHYMFDSETKKKMMDQNNACMTDDFVLILCLMGTYILTLSKQKKNVANISVKIN